MRAISIEFARTELPSVALEQYRKDVVVESSFLVFWSHEKATACLSPPSGLFNHAVLRQIVERYLRNIKSATWQTSCSRYENRDLVFPMIKIDGVCSSDMFIPGISASHERNSWRY